MKNLTLSILFVLATVCTFGQILPDQAQILQQCIDLPALQKYFPVDEAGNPKQICILQHGVSFPLEIEVSKFGKSVQLLDKNQIANMGVTSYFLFWEFKIDQNSAKVDFVYNYPGSENLPKMQRVKLDFQKNNGNWTMLQTYMEEI